MRISALDGWRGIAILFVLFDHVMMFFHNSCPSWWHVGQHGVTIFFVLSGYLITQKLLEPGLDLKSFYVRRFFRLMPVAWAFLGCLWLIGSIIHIQLIWPSETIASVFFYRNYLGLIGKQATMHYWSLSIEEQFYLVWPALILLSSRRAKWIALCAALASSGWAITNRTFYLGVNSLRTEVRCSALLIGCLLAIVLQSKRAKDLFISVAKWAAIPSLVMLAVLIRRHDEVPSLLECIGWGVLVVGSSLAGIRAWVPLAWLGRISYSVYVWNGIALTFARSYPNPVVIILVSLIPVASYYCIEKPFTEIGRRVHSRTKDCEPVSAVPVI